MTPLSETVARLRELLSESNAPVRACEERDIEGWPLAFFGETYEGAKWVIETVRCRVSERVGDSESDAKCYAELRNAAPALLDAAERVEVAEALAETSKHWHYEASRLGSRAEAAESRLAQVDEALREIAAALRAQIESPRPEPDKAWRNLREG